MSEDGGGGGARGHRQSERGRRVAGEGGGAVAVNSKEREERTGQRGRGFLPQKREQTLA